MLELGADASAADGTTRVEEITHDRSTGVFPSPLPNHHSDEKQREEIQRIMKAVSESLKSQSAQAMPEKIRNSIHTLIALLSSQLQGLKAGEAKEARVGSRYPENIDLKFQSGRCRFLRAAEESEFRTHGRSTAAQRHLSLTNDGDVVSRDVLNDSQGLHLALHRAFAS